MIVFKDWIDVVLFIIEMIGCISFASSGAITAIRKKADILGVWILSLIGIFGGGLLRDLIISKDPPHIFWDAEYLVMAAVSLVITTIWFLLAYFKKTAHIIEKHRHDLWIYLLDAIGIAVFCVYGVQTAAANVPESANLVGKYVYMICLGVITGVGGGMFRDVFIGEIPMVFKKHFYMTPCIIGCIVYSTLFVNDVNRILSIVIGIGLIVLLRVLAIRYRWNLPHANGYVEAREQENKQN